MRVDNVYIGLLRYSRQQRMSTRDKVADDTKLFGRIGSSESRDRLKEDLEVLCAWSVTWQMKCNIDKRKVMHISWSTKFGRIFYGRQQTGKCHRRIRFRKID